MICQSTVLVTSQRFFVRRSQMMIHMKWRRRHQRRHLQRLPAARRPRRRRSRIDWTVAWRSTMTSTGPTRQRCVTVILTRSPDTRRASVARYESCTCTCICSEVSISVIVPMSICEYLGTYVFKLLKCLWFCRFSWTQPRISALTSASTAQPSSSGKSITLVFR